MSRQLLSSHVGRLHPFLCEDAQTVWQRPFSVLSLEDHLLLLLWQLGGAIPLGLANGKWAEVMIPLSGLALNPWLSTTLSSPPQQPQRLCVKRWEELESLEALPWAEPSSIGVQAGTWTRNQIKLWGSFVATAEPVLSWLLQRGSVTYHDFVASHLWSQNSTLACYGLQYYTLLMSHCPVLLPNYWFEVKHIVLHFNIFLQHAMPLPPRKETYKFHWLSSSSPVDKNPRSLCYSSQANV